ncbi:nucleoside phosphorylase [Sphingobacteriaceae bacterium WQ 2009]|uniref:Nucleoside phosphorylase n=1 Tax=Rhinopithecimicrobium faecis TaxID=2820698 RepID=A0A8T4HBT1_9SPHI|nr:nucleoside phosphorylase [Sphingobacteriaceae bacterium WQ 2009]
MIQESELIINPDGSIYHLNLLPEDIADTVITVGDPDRVAEVSKYFDRIELKKGKREFITHTGYIGTKRISVISTGIGTDNIDIVLNELDALVNINFQERTINETLKELSIIRIGTSGALQADIPMGTIVASAYGIGFDALMQYYVKQQSVEEQGIQEAVMAAFPTLALKPYVGTAGVDLIAKYAFDLPKGITMTAPGFYAPQGRSLRGGKQIPDLITRAANVQVGDQRITNLEMETAGIYALSNMFGHQALSINAILASRQNGTFHSNPAQVVEEAIKLVLSRF